MHRRSTDPFRPTPRFWRLILTALFVVAALISTASAADCGCTQQCGCIVVHQPAPSWVFQPGRYTHDPVSGKRVAQYMRGPAVEPLDDPRLVSSGYRRNRIVLPGPDGSVDTTYRVQNWGNGYGGLDAEQERVHDAYRGAPTFGGFGGFFPGFFPYFGYPFPGHGHPGPGWPGYGNQPRRLDPDAADGFRSINPRTPDRRFYRNSPWHNRGGNLGPGS